MLSDYHHNRVITGGGTGLERAVIEAIHASVGRREMSFCGFVICTIDIVVSI